MDEPKAESDFHALRNMLDEGLLTESASVLPDGRGARATEILTAALALADDMLAAPDASWAAAMGKPGGAKTAQRSPKSFKELAAKR